MKTRNFALALIGVAALFAAGCANDEANSTASCNSSDKACTSGEKSGCCQDKAASGGECCKKEAEKKQQ